MGSAEGSLKASFEAAWAEAELVHRSGDDGRAAAARHAEGVDALLVDLFGNAAGSSAAGLSLVALGGYGRRELAPYSDLDLLLLHRGWDPDDLEKANRRLFYPLWDAGRDVGNRVRDVRETLRHLDRVDEAAAVLDARHLAGDEGLTRDLIDSVREHLVGSSGSFFRSMVEATRVRHEGTGHVGHLLEPDLRDGAGGLRDIHTVGWAAALRGGPQRLVEDGLLTERDRTTLDDAHGILLRIRIELHLVAGRRQDRLHLADQDEVASRLGFGGDAPGTPLLQDVHRRAREVDAIVSSLWGRLTHRRRLWRPSVKTLGDGCVIRSGRLEVVAATSADVDPAGWLKAYRHAMRNDVPVARASSNRLQESLATDVRWTPEARAVFEDILRGGRRAVRILEAMDAVGLLGALIGGWEPVSALPQRDLYHRFTVDRHLFETVAELVESRTSAEPEVEDAWSRIPDDGRLMWAALLHDVGKGRGGDHSRIGERIASEAVGAAGLDPAAVDDVGFCVRHHLLLAETALRRDLADEATIAEIAATVGDVGRLAMLFLHTRADSIATGPEAWTVFRAALVRELYARTMAHLEGRTAVARSRDAEAIVRELEIDEADATELASVLPASWVEQPGSEVARRLAVVRAGRGSPDVRTAAFDAAAAQELVVVAPDRPGLFALVTGVLALRGVDVLAAGIATLSDGRAVEVFEVRGAHDRVTEGRWERIADDIAAAVAGDLDLDAALARKAEQLPTRRPPSIRDDEVEVDPGARGGTLIEVHTTDRLGLLRDLAKALTDSGCDIRRARVATYGSRVVDVFWVVDARGEAITDPDALERIEGTLLAVCGDRGL